MDIEQMPKRIAAWRFHPNQADEWLHGGWSEDHDHKTTAYVLEAEVLRLTAIVEAADALERAAITYQRAHFDSIISASDKLTATRAAYRALRNPAS